MQGWKNGEGGLGCFERGAHELCLFVSNQGVTLFTRRISVRGWTTWMVIGSNEGGRVCKRDVRGINGM